MRVMPRQLNSGLVLVKDPLFVQEPGKALAAKLCAHLRPKCHVLLLDASISSAICVRRNIFQIALPAAMKLHCQVSTAACRSTHALLYVTQVTWSHSCQ